MHADGDGRLDTADLLARTQERRARRSMGDLVLDFGELGAAIVRHERRQTPDAIHARIDALVAQGVLTAAQGTDLAQSLHFFMGLRLKAGLADLAAHRTVSGEVAVARLNSLDRDLLKDTLAVVKRFRTQLQQRYRLDAL